MKKSNVNTCLTFVLQCKNSKTKRRKDEATREVWRTWRENTNESSSTPEGERLIKMRDMNFLSFSPREHMCMYVCFWNWWTGIIITVKWTWKIVSSRLSMRKRERGNKSKKLFLNLDSQFKNLASFCSIYVRDAFF